MCFLSTIHLSSSVFALCLTQLPHGSSLHAALVFGHFVENTPNNMTAANPQGVRHCTCACVCVRERELTEVCLCECIVRGVCIRTTGGRLLRQLIKAAFIRAIDSCERSEPFQTTSNFYKMNAYTSENNHFEW